MSDDFVQVIDESTLQRRVSELADDIIGDFPDGDLVVVGILKGSLIFMKDLLQHLPLTSVPEFLSLTRFGREGRVSIALDVSEPLEGRDVLLVLEIVDTGLTSAFLLSELGRRDVKSLSICTLINRPARRVVPIELDHVGLEIPDRYVIGYGLDHHGRYRNLRVLATADTDVLAKDPDAYVEALYGA